MNKRQLIDEIVSLNQTAEPCFLARFDDDDLTQYLQHLREARRPRLSAPTGRFDRYFRPVPPVSQNVRPLSRPAASSTWRVEPASAKKAVAAKPVPAGACAGAETCLPAPAIPAAPPAAASPAKKDAAAEVDLDRLADEDLDLAIRWSSYSPVQTCLQVAAAPAPSALQSPALDLMPDPVEAPGQQPAELASDQAEPDQEQLELPAQPELIADAVPADDFAPDLADEEVTPEEKAALSQDEPLDQAEEYEESDLEAFEAPAPLEPAVADAIETIQDILNLSQQASEQPELTEPQAQEEPVQADSAAPQAPTDLVAALEAEPVEPDLEPAAHAKAPPRRARRDENDVWLF